MLKKITLLNYLFILFLCSCSQTKKVPLSKYLEGLKQATISLNDGTKIRTYLAKSEFEQMKGLSGTQDSQFLKTDAMLFFNENDQTRSFWMPDTYFNLDIYFLDMNFKILQVERNVPHHPGRENMDSVYRTNHYNCRHVLELKTSEVSAKIKIGDTLKISF